MNGNNSGHVRVYEYQVISGTATWTQLGQDIDGDSYIKMEAMFLYLQTEIKI